MVEVSPPVDIIIVNYNGMAYIQSCLESVFSTDYHPFSVIVVDNDSKDDSPEWIREHYPQVRLIQNKANLGFGKANMIGLHAGSAPLVALLNSDTVVTQAWLSPLVQEIHENQSVGAVCSKLLFLKNPRIMNSAGGGMNFVGYGYDIGIFEINNGRFDEKKEVFFPCAAACLLQRSVLEEVGGFDKQFFMYHEDVDLGWRLHVKGYKIVYIPTSVVYHAFGGTSAKSGGMAFRNRLGQRHALRSLLKNYELSTLAKAIPTFLGLSLRTSIKERSLDFLRCVSWNVKKLPNTLKMRKRIQRSRRVSDRKLLPLIWQKVVLPYQFPDYESLDLGSFSESENKKHWIEMADRNSTALGYGWHALEADFRDERIRYRWSKEEAIFYLWNPFGDSILEMEILGLSNTLSYERKFLLSVNGKTPHEFTVKSDEWEKITVPFPGEKGPLEIKISVERPWCPDEYFHNGDARLLGIGCKAAALMPKYSLAGTFTGISVVIPTYNRSQKLLNVLSALDNQTLAKDLFEVIIVDDGSTDSTKDCIEAFGKNTAMTIINLSQSNKKQGAARNYGIKYAKMPLVCFLGDDIVPEPNFLEEHIQFHKRHNRDGNVVMIGYTQWPKEVRVTPFMRYIGEYGHQFGYSLIKGNDPLPFNFFYTSNISMPTSLLSGLEYIFEEDFETYGWEDIELGYRLEKMGMRLLYNPAAVAYHDHTTDILAFCRRQFKVGKASRTFLKKHPELEWFLGNQEYLRKLAKWGRLAHLAAGVEHVLDKIFLLPLPAVCYKSVLKVNYATGSTHSESLL